MRVKDLKDQINAPYPRPFLYCVECGEQFSAEKGDYFMADPATELMHCGEPMILAVSHMVIEQVA